VLTEEEKRVLELLAHGGNVEEMAAELAMSPDTVRRNVQSILAKLQVHSRLEAVRRLRDYPHAPGGDDGAAGR
jgi:DNA-binding NarL/FixJ family response regulator